MASGGTAVPPAQAERQAARLATAQEHLTAIGHEARPAGSEAEARARRYAAGVLGAAGYAVREELFPYSALPGRYGAPVAGAVSLAALLTASVAGMRDRPAVGGVILLMTLGVLAGMAGWAADHGVRRWRWLRRDGVNLVAEPAGFAAASADGRGRPHVWLVAHLDTKSQPVPMTARVAGVALLVIAWLAGLCLSAVHALGWMLAVRAMPVWPFVALVALVGAVPVVLSVVGTESPGALDNASGVAAVLLAAQELAASAAVRDDGTAAPRAPVGVVLTSAEELGLAGARAWTDAWEKDGRAPGVALNCDVVDDVGRVTLLRAGVPPATFLAEARRAARGARVRRAPPGVLTDAVAFGAADWAALTVSRGRWRSLARVHARSDSLARLRGDGIPEAAGVLARIARLSVALSAAGEAD